MFGYEFSSIIFEKWLVTSWLLECGYEWTSWVRVDLGTSRSGYELTWYPLLVTCIIILDPVTLTLEFDPFFENIKLANDFWTVSARAFILHMSISCDKIYLLVSRYLSLWPWPSLELAIIGSICVSQTHLVGN